MKKLFCGIAFAALSSGSAIAADQGDIYFEAEFGIHANHSAKQQSAFNFGYVPLDDLGIGIDYSQYYATATRFAGEAGSQIGLEGRWFLEPVEAYFTMGAFVSSINTRGFIQLGVNYLYALTPAVSLKVDARTRLVFPKSWSPYLSLGARLLF